MKADNQNPLAESHPATATLTLQPLATDGPAALDTHDIPELAKATLTGIETLSKNTALGVTIRKADDLFATETVPGTTLFPANTTIAQATFELQLTNASRPHKVSIRPPNTLTLEFPTDAPLVLQWLGKRHLRIIAAILLALASPTSPALDDDDGDEDDCSSDRLTLAHAA